MEEEKIYYIVNPKGTIHIVTQEHAKARLQLPGWRLANKDEIQKYREAGGNQRFDFPLAQPWNPEIIEQEVPEDAAEVVKKVRRAMPNK